MLFSFGMLSSRTGGVSVMSLQIAEPSGVGHALCRLHSSSLHGFKSRNDAFDETLISNADCRTAAQSTSFIITLQPTITEPLRGVNFSCLAFTRSTSTLKQTAGFVVDNIKGELLNIVTTELI